MYFFTIAVYLQVVTPTMITDFLGTSVGEAGSSSVFTLPNVYEELNS
jgi:hypothetical protein